MSLHSTTDTVKKIFAVGGISVICLLLLVIVINIIKGLIPKKEAPPTVSYGQLPQIPFPTATPTPQTTPPTYALETLSGTFPSFPDQESVYQITQPQPDLLMLKNAKALIPTNDFPNDPQALSDIVYQWTSPNPPYKILTYNILSHDFTMTSSYLTNPDIVAASNLGDEQNAISVGRNFLTELNGYPSTIDPEKTKTTLYSVNTTTHTLQPAISLSTTHVIWVDYFPKDINELPVYFTHPPHSLFYVIVGSINGGSTAVEANYINRDIVTDTDGTYPIKSPQQAFDELQSASPSAFIAAPSDPPVATVNIRQVSLGYYLGQINQAYLMPIYIFQGDNGFYGYVSAVTDTWIKK